MKAMIQVAVVLVFIVVGVVVPVLAQESKTADLDDEAAKQKVGGVKSIEKRVKHLEEMIGRPVEGDKWVDRIQISGLIEIEAAHETIDYKDPATPDEKSNDVDLATVELIVDARVIDHVNGHVMFKYEDDFQETDGVTAQLAVEF